jgi:hypothetical protein
METILGLFKQCADACSTVRALLKAGFSRDEVSVLSHEELFSLGSHPGEQRKGVAALKDAATGPTSDLLGALAPLVIPVENARLYAEGIRRGGALVITRTTSDLAPAVEAILVAAHADEVCFIHAQRAPDNRDEPSGELVAGDQELPLLWRVLQEAY